MKEIIIKTQKELDDLALDFNGTVYIEGGTYYDPLILRVRFEQASVVCRGQSVIEMWESSQVNVMRESSQVKEMWGSSQVNVMRESSQVNVMWESSQVKEMRESSQVKEMWGEAMVSAYGLQKLICHGYNVIRTRKSNEKNLTVALNDTSHLVVIPDKESTFDWFKKNYPVKEDGEYVTLYKSVHKVGEEYQSDKNRKFTYKIGQTKNEKCDPSTEESCSNGIHVSHLSWAVDFGKNWPDIAVLECKVKTSTIVVAKDCDGKVRTSEVFVVRELGRSEYKQYL